MMDLDKVRDLLFEAQRYVATQPDVARQYAGGVLGWITSAALAAETPNTRDSLFRIASNLHEARRWVRVDPTMFKGYCYAASFELSHLLGGKEGC